METAKVDVRKLQLLNDRINQTIDALQQVRLSVHGLQATPGIGVGQGAGIGQPWFAGGAQLPVPGLGLSHTSGINPYNNPLLAQMYGIGQQGFGLGQSTLQQNPLLAQMYGVGQQGIGSQYPQFGGLSHTSALNPLAAQLGYANTASPWTSWAYGINPQVAQVGGLNHTSSVGVNPFLPPAYGQSTFGQSGLGYGASPYLPQTGGLSHSSVESSFVDPYWAMRVRETFPFAFVNVPGMPSLY